MTDPTMEDLNRPRTAEEIDASLVRIGKGKVRRCIPARSDDDDLVMAWVIGDREKLIEAARAAAANLAGYVYDCEVVAGDCASLRIKGALNALRRALRDEESETPGSERP